MISREFFRIRLFFSLVLSFCLVVYPSDSPQPIHTVEVVDGKKPDLPKSDLKPEHFPQVQQTTSTSVNSSVVGFAKDFGNYLFGTRESDKKADEAARIAERNARAKKVGEPGITVGGGYEKRQQQKMMNDMARHAKPAPEPNKLPPLPQPPAPAKPLMTPAQPNTTMLNNPVVDPLVNSGRPVLPNMNDILQQQQRARSLMVRPPKIDVPDLSKSLNTQPVSPIPQAPSPDMWQAISGTAAAIGTALTSPVGMAIVGTAVVVGGGYYMYKRSTAPIIQKEVKDALGISTVSHARHEQPHSDFPHGEPTSHVPRQDHSLELTKKSHERKSIQEPDPRTRGIKMEYPKNVAQLDHEFDDRFGHFKELTPGVRDILDKCWREGHYLGQDAVGNHQVTWVNPHDGNQIYIKYRNDGIIKECGANKAGKHVPINSQGVLQVPRDHYPNRKKQPGDGTSYSMGIGIVEYLLAPQESKAEEIVPIVIPRLHLEYESMPKLPPIPESPNPYNIPEPPRDFTVEDILAENKGKARYLKAMRIQFEKAQRLANAPQNDYKAEIRKIMNSKNS